MCNVPLSLSQCVVGEREDEVWIKEEGRGKVGLEDRKGGEKKSMGMYTCISDPDLTWQPCLLLREKVTESS